MCPSVLRSVHSALVPFVVKANQFSPFFPSLREQKNLMGQLVMQVLTLIMELISMLLLDIGELHI